MPQRATMNTTQSSKRSGSLRIALSALFACAAGALSMSASALPVIPGAAGYGMDTPAGRGGKVYKVTTLAESGPGSLRECTDAKGPRVCVFEVSGTIRITKDITIRNPNITIAGQTAPSPGIMLRGGAIWVKASDVLIQHVRVRPGDDPEGSPPINRDALKISHDTPFKNVVIDHCSFAWAIDEVASLMNNWDNITLSNNIFAEPLHESMHPEGNHGFGILIESGRVSMVGNLLASNLDRNPHSRAPHLVFANNVVYNPKSAIKLGTLGGGTTLNTVIGNVFIPGPDTGKDAIVQIRAAGENALSSGSRVYLADNVAPSATDDPWSIAGPYAVGGDHTRYRTNTPPTWPANLTRLPTSGNVVLNHVLKYAGARPADRDPVDRRIVEGVKNRTGRSINCVSANGTKRCERNAGGWPKLAENRRTLTLPANPNQVTESGYTNLELWLHEMAAQVEGRSSRPPTPPKLAAGN